MRGSLLGICLLSAVFAYPARVGAQVLGDLTESRSSNAAFYSFKEPGDITISVSVWGGVVHPGLYELPEDVRLNTVITLAGGLPLGMIDNGSSQVERTLHLRLLRPSDSSYDVVYQQLMRDGIVISDTNPVLRNGDFLVVELEERDRKPFTWRDGLSVTTGIAALALAAERMISVLQ